MPPPTDVAVVVDFASSADVNSFDVQPNDISGRSATRRDTFHRIPTDDGYPIVNPTLCSSCAAARAGTLQHTRRLITSTLIRSASPSLTLLYPPSAAPVSYCLPPAASYVSAEEL